MKTDARVRYTQMVIKESFISLMRQKPVNKITVKEVCEKAQVNRATFYKHYLDCYDLLEQIESDALNNFDEMFAAMEENGLRPTLVMLLGVLKENAEMFAVLGRHGLEDHFSHRIAGRCFRHMERALQLEPGMEGSAEKKKMAYAFLAGGAGALIEYWIRSGYKESPEQAAQTILDLVGRIAGM